MKKIIKSLSIIGMVAAIAIGATVAYFQDTETSAGNTFSAGVLDLLIADNDEGFGNGVTATWVAEDMKPGDEKAFKVNEIRLAKEIGSVDADHTEITCDYNAIEENPQTESDTDPNTDLDPDKMAKEMLITRCIYHDSVCIDCLTGIKWSGYSYANGVCGGTNLGRSDDWKIEDQNSDGKISFYDLKNDKIDNLPAVPNSPPFSYLMSVKFDNGAGNDFQGDIFDLTMMFTLNQDASQ